MLKWFFCYFGSKRFSSLRTLATRVRSYPSLTPQFFTATSNLGHQPIFQIFLLLDKWVFRLIWFLAARFSLNPNPIGLGFVWLCTRWMRHILLWGGEFRAGQILLPYFGYPAPILDRPTVCLSIISAPSWWQTGHQSMRHPCWKLPVRVAFTATDSIIISISLPANSNVRVVL